jgi:AbiTii
MTVPLILQIQQVALDSKSSLTDALRKAKIACIKLGLIEFGDWVDKELNGYMEVPNSELPEYRKIHGRAEVFNRYHGWNAIQFRSSQQQDSFSLAPIGFAISLVEDAVPQDMEKDTSFNFQLDD